MASKESQYAMGEYPGLLDVGGASLVESLGLDRLCDMMEEHTGTAPQGIVYPLLSTAGPNWDSKLVRSGILSDRRGPASLPGVAEYCAQHKLKLWLVVCPNLSFLASDGIQCVDNYGNSSASCCINSRPFRRAFHALLNEAKAALGSNLGTLEGVVFDAQDMWPMGGQQGTIQLNCFCRYCVRALARYGFSATDLEAFKRYPGPLNLLLEATKTGMRHSHDLDEDKTAAWLVMHSYEQTFYAWNALKAEAHISLAKDTNSALRKAENGPVLLEWAETLLRYLKARQASTLESLKGIFAQLAETFPGCTRAITSEGLAYNWTAGLFQKAIDRDDFYDESWIVASQDLPEDKPCRTYTCDRGRYMVQSLFTALEMTRSPHRNLTAAGRTERLRRHVSGIATQACAAVPHSPVQILALEHSNSSMGYVWPALQIEPIEDLLDKLAPQEGILPEDLMRMFQSARQLDESSGGASSESDTE